MCAMPVVRSLFIIFVSLVVCFVFLIAGGLYLVFVPKPAQKAQWYAQSVRVDDLQRAVRLAPDRTDYWIAYVTALQKQCAEAERIHEGLAALRDLMVDDVRGYSQARHRIFSLRAEFCDAG